MSIPTQAASEDAPLRSLNLVYSFPYPPRSGYDLRVWNITRCLGRSMRQTLLCRHHEPVREQHELCVRRANIEPQSLPIPRPRLAEKMTKGLRFALGDDPLMSAGYYFEPMERRLESLLAATPYDFIVMEGIWLSSYWPVIQRSKALKVLNHFDLETVRLSRAANLQKSPFWKWFYRSEARRMRRLERRIMDSADLVWVTSDLDRRGLAAVNPDWPVEVAPNGVDAERIRPLPPEPASREILFVGSYDNFPNEDAVLYFTREVFPLVRKGCPDAVFRIVGRNPTKAVLDLAQAPGVRVDGALDSLDPVYRAAALLAVPLRTGGGTRLKILEAMAYGRPVVSTRLGAEGLNFQDGLHLSLADTPEAMARAILDLLADPERGRAMAVRARASVEEQYTWTSIAGRMYERYRNLAERKRKGVA